MTTESMPGAPETLVEEIIVRVNGAFGDAAVPELHAKLRLAYAIESLYNREAWRNWEVKRTTSINWEACRGEPDWNGMSEFRRRSSQGTTELCGAQYPSPLTVLPEEGEIVYYADMMTSSGSWCISLTVSENNREWLSGLVHAGLLHDNKDAAVRHALVLRQLATGQVFSG